ncbi:YhbY family RNA-binding protein [Piscinibacter sakaiensis]|uniref:RNA binding protein n=1 Tax=Piscinibacter sakaiensis TaxID=1547922 RepID=A0A0K8NW67_PISS1|nr:YhbY family RNA-binding protein [Piscinibacter sakaiensis]GAP34647.1 RNA binding protein [Piscinibacter sakaiensis]
MPALHLTPAQRKDQRAAAHHLDPVVHVGADGLTPAVVREVDAALTAHGLIKVRVFSDERPAREAMLAELAEALGAAPVQHIGKLLVLWRPVPPKEKAQTEGRGAAPRQVKVVKFSKTGNHRPQIKRITLLGNERLAAGGEVKRARKRAGSVKKKAAP